MKRYEKMGIDLRTKEGLIKVFEVCPRKIEKDYACEGSEQCHFCETESCGMCVVEYLMSDVPVKKVKRWETYNGDFVQAQTEFNVLCKKELVENGCINCSLSRSGHCFGSWLMEEIEIEVEE